MGRGVQVEIEHWEAHLWHLMCGVWSDRRCRVCAMASVGLKQPAQWNQRPQVARPAPICDSGAKIDFFSL